MGLKDFDTEQHKYPSRAATEGSTAIWSENHT